MAAQALRVVDVGSVGALRSQSLWHGIASAMAPGSPPVLSFCRPAVPYVSIGYHRRLDELDLPACRALRLPVLRRRIGGGPVYLDADQLFFQLTLPASSAPSGVKRLYGRLLEPAALAFRSMGLDARLDGLNDVVVDDRKVSGTGAGQIGGGITVVGNVMFRFPHKRMAAVLALPGEDMRAESLWLMRRYVSSLAAEGRGDIGLEEAKTAFRDAYAAALGLEVRRSEPSGAELEAIGRWERRLRDSAWLAGPPLPEHPVRQVKVRAGVFALAGGDDALRALVTVVHGRLERVHVEGASLNGTGERMEAALRGTPAKPAALAARLEPFGDAGASLIRMLEPGLVLR